MGQRSGDAQRSGGRGAPSGPVLLLVGVLVGALIALGVFLVMDRDSGQGASDAAAVSTAPGTGVPSSGDDEGAGVVSPPPTSAPDEPDTEATSPFPPPAQPEPASDPDVMRDGENLIAPAAGPYSGIVFQRGTERSDQSLQVAMGFSSTGSYVEYPTLGCSGTLTPTGNQGGARVYRETITSGQCDSTGTWYVTRESDTAISAEYRPSAGEYVVEGELSR